MLAGEYVNMLYEYLMGLMTLEPNDYITWIYIGQYVLLLLNFLFMIGKLILFGYLELPTYG